MAASTDGSPVPLALKGGCPRVPLHTTPSSTSASSGDLAHRWEEDLEAGEQAQAWQVCLDPAAQNTLGVNVRAQPRRDAARLRAFPVGTIVNGVLEGNWVRLVDSPGYMLAKEAAFIFLRPLDLPAKGAGNSLVKEWTVCADPAAGNLKGVNVREQPSCDAPRIKSFPVGSVVKGVLEGGWVRLVDSPGYMLAKQQSGPVEWIFLKEVEPVTAADSAPCCLYRPASKLYRVCVACGYLVPTTMLLCGALIVLWDPFNFYED